MFTIDMFNRAKNYKMSREEYLKKFDNLMSINDALAEVVMNNVLGCDNNLDPLANIDNLLEAKSLGDGDYNINTWPFGRTTKKIYKELIAICRGTTNLDNILRKTVDWCKRVSQEFPEVDKTAVIITDKWRPQTFDKYKDELRDFAYKDNIWTVIVLVTENGATLVPFLPRERKEYKIY